MQRKRWEASRVLSRHRGVVNGSGKRRMTARMRAAIVGYRQIKENGDGQNRESKDMFHSFLVCKVKSTSV